MEIGKNQFVPLSPSEIRRYIGLQYCSNRAICRFSAIALIGVSLLVLVEKR
ncbi:hypothetical protein L211DRAFT_143705 [Terfezia boudieri ATCC MYA-4762]|uniref:Uncharacterized protein n=1 Tax=Terfezia boudieri ATCC MYA-4762 TaxID=1051890 RepID=A0A3N4LP67_9PEZI|nr:hypothetical protein L211DRAFT_143705 [Terfezia boudieri ATCC MYA-4762]